MVELDRVMFNGSLLTMRMLTSRMAKFQKEMPWMRISVDLKWRADDHKVAIQGSPRFVLPIKGVA